MKAPFVIESTRFGGETVHLLPTANVVMVVGARHADDRIHFALPHRGVLQLDNVAECASLSPNFVKCLLGEPRRHLNRVIAAAEHPMLAPFVEIRDVAGATELLEDLRNSLTVTPDERDFDVLWASYTAARPLPTGDRRVQRLCLRYAGQPPAALNTVSRLARTLDADNVSGLYNGLGEFADASHFARVCKSGTGRTPTAWRNMSQAFY